jgi:hypothetical protein
MIERLDQCWQVDILVLGAVFPLLGLAAVSLAQSSGLRLCLFDVEVNYFEVLHIDKSFLLHHCQHLGNALFGCPYKHQALAHQTTRFQFQLLKILHVLSFFPPVNIHKNGLHILPQ